MTPLTLGSAPGTGTHTPSELDTYKNILGITETDFFDYEHPIRQHYQKYLALREILAASRVKSWTEVKKPTENQLVLIFGYKPTGWHNYKTIFSGVGSHPDMVAWLLSKSSDSKETSELWGKDFVKIGQAELSRWLKERLLTSELRSALPDKHSEVADKEKKKKLKADKEKAEQRKREKVKGKQKKALSESEAEENDEAKDDVAEEKMEVKKSKRKVKKA